MIDYWKRFIKNQYNYWFPKISVKDQRPPSVTGKIQYNEVKKILSSHCVSSRIFLADPYYATTSQSEAERFSKESLIDARNYLFHVYDCDNYSYSMKGHWSDSLISYCYGIAWTKTHAFNVLIDQDKQVWIHEPQKNKWYKVEKLKKRPFYYPFRLVMI